MDSRHKKTVIIDQLNINSVNNKKNELQLFATTHREKIEGNIICLNDTRLTKSKRLKIKGYRTLRKDHSSGRSRAGGVAILFKNGMRVTEIANDIEEFVIIELSNNNMHIRVATVYLHPGEILMQRHIDELEKDQSNSHRIDAFILIGDMNAHCGLDRAGKFDRAGRMLNNLININNYTILNDESPTYYSTGNNISSCIDICLVKTNRPSIIDKWTTGDNLGSDHVMTSLLLSCKYQAETRTRKNTNWVKVREEMSLYSPDVKSQGENEINSSIEELGDTIKKAVEKNSKSEKIFIRDNIKLTYETAELISLRRKINKLRKTWEEKNRPTDIIRKTSNFINKEIRRLIKRDVEASTAIKLADLSETKDASKSWRLLKEMEPDIGKTRAETVSDGIEDAQGIIKKDDDSIALIHANRLAEAHSFPTDSKFDDNFKQRIKSEVASLPSLVFKEVNKNLQEAPLEDFTDADRIGRFGKKHPPLIHDNKITTNEIYFHLRRKKNKSSGGPDGVTYKMLKHAGVKTIGALAKILTILLASGYFPESWRSVTVSMIPKPGKNLRHAKNWRPISLSSCISKLFECCIKERLEREMKKRKIKENIHQAAYKKGRCCQEHILRLSEDVTHAFARQESTLAVFLDVSGAFDKVWVDGLIWKIMQMSLPSNLLNIIRGFLTNRSLRVKIGSTISQIVHMQAGTPQGAVLSPSLYNIFVDDLQEVICSDNKIHLAQYADDIAIWTSDKNIRMAERRINAALERIAEWTLRWRVKLAPEKSTYILFTRRPTHKRESLRVQLLGSDIQRNEHHRFLGVVFDEKLDWKPHVSGMIGSAIPRINALRRLSAKNIWRNPTWILSLHEAVVNSIWKYGSLAYAPMGNHLWDRITSLHASAIKSYCGVPRCTGYSVLCDHIGIGPIKEELLAFARKRLSSIAAYSPFGQGIISQRRKLVTGIYKSPSEVLIHDHEVDND